MKALVGQWLIIRIFRDDWYFSQHFEDTLVSIFWSAPHSISSKFKQLPCSRKFRVESQTLVETSWRETLEVQLSSCLNGFIFNLSPQNVRCRFIFTMLSNVKKWWNTLRSCLELLMEDKSRAVSFQFHRLTEGNLSAKICCHLLRSGEEQSFLPTALRY